MWTERLAEYLKDRPAQIKEAKEKGTKVIGYFPGNYVPDELIMAAGAIPVCLIAGGDTQPLEAATAVIPNIFCPFSRAQLGERLLQRDPYYGLIDMLVGPITCQHLKKVAEIWEYKGELPIFKLGIPHQTKGDFELEYYTGRLQALRERLEAFTGNKITDEKIKEAIVLNNRMRALLKELSQMRRADASPIDAVDFVKLNHASCYADPAFMVEMLESVVQELKESQPAAPTGAPRLLLVGPNIGQGDYGIMNTVKEVGGNIVIEEICEGVRYYWHTIDTNGDPLAALAQGYLRDRVPCAFMRDSASPRFNFALKLIDDFNVSGVIWYQLLGCETYDAESFFFNQRMGENNIPMLILESDYGMADAGQSKVRLEAFIEMVRGGLD